MIDLLVLLIGVLILLLMIIKFKINTFVSLIVVAVLVGLGLGMPLGQIPVSIQNGIGGSLGELAIVFGFGAMLGRLIAMLVEPIVSQKRLLTVLVKKEFNGQLWLPVSLLGLPSSLKLGWFS